MILYSVIIATYNRAKLLKQCLDAVTRQTVPHNSYEVIVTNDGSRDNTDDVTKKFRHNHPEVNFTYIKQDNHGVSHARNQGIKRAKGDIVFFTDDDCVVPENWIETLADGYRRHPDVAGVGGWYKYSDKIYQKSTYARFTIFSVSAVRPIHKEIKSVTFTDNLAGNTSNMSYLRSILQKTGGFDENMRIPGYDDWELKKRVLDLKYPLLYTPLSVLHDRPLSFIDIAIRIFRFGRGRYLFTLKHQDLFNAYRPSFNKQLNFIHAYIPLYRIDFLALAFINSLLVRIGWEYEKLFGRQTHNN